MRILRGKTRKLAVNKTKKHQLNHADSVCRAQLDYSNFSRIIELTNNSSKRACLPPSSPCGPVVDRLCHMHQHALMSEVMSQSSIFCVKSTCIKG